MPFDDIYAHSVHNRHERMESVACFESYSRLNKARGDGATEYHKMSVVASKLSRSRCGYSSVSVSEEPI